MKFSIIMPTYNCEKYVGEAIESVLNQTFNDFELIIVDDGSGDGTLAICEEFAKNKEKVHLFKAEHGGVSKARNYGLEKACGAYVLFIDCDDTWEKDLLESVNSLLDEKSELVLFGIKHDYYLSDDSFQYSSEDLGESGQIEAVQIDGEVDRLLTAYNISSPCNKVYKREIIEKNTLSFSEKCVYLEDLKFNFDYLQYASSIKVLHRDLYHYRLFTDKKQMLKRKFSEQFVNADELYYSTVTFLNEKNTDLCSVSTITGLLLAAYFKELLCQINQKRRKEIKCIYRAFKKNKNLIILLKASKGKFSKILLIMGNSFLMLQLSLIKRRYE